MRYPKLAHILVNIQHVPILTLHSHNVQRSHLLTFFSFNVFERQQVAPVDLTLYYIYNYRYAVSIEIKVQAENCIFRFAKKPLSPSA